MLNQKHYPWHVRTQQEGEHFRSTTNTITRMKYVALTR